MLKAYKEQQEYFAKETIRESCRASKKLPDLLKVFIPKRNANGVALLPRDTFED